MQRKRKLVYANKKTSHITLLKRTVLVFSLLGIALLLALPIVNTALRSTGVLGDKIYLAHNDEPEDLKMQEEVMEPTQADDNPQVICKLGDGKRYKISKADCIRISDEKGRKPEYEIIQSTPVPSPTRPEHAEPTRLPAPPTATPVTSQTAESTESQNTQTVQTQSGQETSGQERTTPLPQTPIEVQTKDGSETIDINSKNIHIILNPVAGHIVVQAQHSDGTSVELEDDALFHIQERLAIDRIKIATTSANEFLIQKNSSAALTDFPLSWDLTTNSLVVTTPAGRKNVPVLPDEAVKNLIATNELDQTTLPESLKTDRSVNLGTILDIATLTSQNGEPVYEITGIKGQNLFGLFPVAIEKTVEVSGETGKIIGTNETFTNRAVDLLSF